MRQGSSLVAMTGVVSAKTVVFNASTFTSPFTIGYRK